MKNNAIIRIVIFSVTILVLLGLLVWGLSSFKMFSFPRLTSSSGGWEEAVPVSDETAVSVNADQVTNLNIEWVSGAITIQPGDVEEITFQESGISDEKYTMVWKQSGNQLSIQFCKDTISFSGFSINNVLSKDLVITVPRDWTCSSLEIDAASASLYVNDLTIRDVEIDSASGACTFDNCTVDSIDLDTASGDVKFYGSLKELDCDAASASFTGVLTNVPSRMNMDTMSGDLDITLPADCGFTVSMDAMSSDFSSDFAYTTKNGNYVCGDGACRINVSAMSGDVIIRKCADDAGTHQHDESCTTPDSTCPDQEGHH